MTTETETETINARQAATLMGVHVNTVCRWLASGRLIGIRNGRDWEIPRAAVDAIADARAAELREYVEAVAAHDGLAAWLPRAHATALAELLIACDDTIAAWRDCDTLGDTSARVARKERLEQLDAVLTALFARVDRIRLLREIAVAAEEIAQDARERGRAVDETTTAVAVAARERAGHLRQNRVDE